MFCQSAVNKSWRFGCGAFWCEVWVAPRPSRKASGHVLQANTHTPLSNIHIDCRRWFCMQSCAYNKPKHAQLMRSNVGRCSTHTWPNRSPISMNHRDTQCTSQKKVPDRTCSSRYSNKHVSRHMSNGTNVGQHNKKEKRRLLPSSTFCAHFIHVHNIGDEQEINAFTQTHEAQ